MNNCIKHGLSTLVLLAVLFWMPLSVAEEAATDSGMTNNKLDELVKRFDKNAQSKPGFWQLRYDDTLIYVITDEDADRMRIIVEVAEAKQFDKEHLYRIMQSNFDSALDARYAIAQGSVWSAFIHPLASLSEKEFFSGLAQTITLAKTFGTTFSSGALTFNGGDSRAEHEKLYQKLLKKGLSV